MAKDITKLFCDLLSAGAQMQDSSVSPIQIVQHTRYLKYEHLPKGFFVDFKAVQSFIIDRQAALRGAGFDIEQSSD